MKTINLDPQSIATAGPIASEILSQTQSALGFIPNLYANLANSEGLISTYKFGYDAIRESKLFTSAEQEVIFLTVSRENQCSYCVSAHSMIADKMSGVPQQVLTAIREGKQIQDPQLAALAKFTKVMHDTRGFPTNADTEEFFAAGYSPAHILEIILAIAVKTISNYTNHALQAPIDSAFSSYEWTPVNS